MKIESYIFFTDQCAEAMRFYEKALGGKIEAMMKYGDSPAGPHNPPEMADLGQLVVEVGVAPTYPAEFVIFRIGRTRDTLEITE